MKYNKIPYLLILAISLYSCETIPLDTEDDEPEFEITFNVGPDEYAFAAGIDGYSMETEILQIGPSIYIGSLVHQENQIPVDGMPFIDFKFQLSEEVKNTIDPDHFNSFRTGQIPYNTQDDAALPVKEVVFNAVYDGTGNEPVFTWDYGDGSGVEFRNPIHAYPEISEYEATVFVVDDNQCQASATNTVSFDGREDCESEITVNNISTASAVLETVSDGVPPLTYNWSNGATSKDVSVDVLNTAGSQEHCVTITDANNCQSVSCIGIVYTGSGTPDYCGVDMSETNYRRAATAIQYNSVEITFDDGNNREFNSREALQNPDAFFNVISFEEYQMNAAGERTVRIEFEFSCTLYETLATNPTPASGRGVIAVAIP